MSGQRCATVVPVHLIVGAYLVFIPFMCASVCVYLCVVCNVYDSSNIKPFPHVNVGIGLCDEGMEALAAALEAGACTQLTTLDLAGEGPPFPLKILCSHPGCERARSLQQV